MPTARIVPGKFDDHEVPGSQELIDSLPELIRTPQGVVLIEVKGVLKRGEEVLIETDMDINKNVVHSQTEEIASQELVTLGDLDLTKVESENKVVLTLGGHRINGKVSKLPNPVAVLRPIDPNAEEIPVIQVIRYKLVFDKLPEPIPRED